MVMTEKERSVIAVSQSASFRSLTERKEAGMKQHFL
jgi:hypothetical protein